MNTIPNPFGAPLPTTPTTTLAPPCVPVYKSVTLKKDEKFILPSGAVIIGATDPTAIQSDCATIKLSAECCWAFRFDSLQSNDQFIVGIYFDEANKSYTFDAIPYSQFFSVSFGVNAIGNVLINRISASAGISNGGPVLATSYNNNGTTSGVTEHTVWIKSFCEFGRPHLIIGNPNWNQAFVTTYDLVRATTQDCSNFGGSLGQGDMTFAQLGL